MPAEIYILGNEDDRATAQLIASKWLEAEVYFAIRLYPEEILDIGYGIHPERCTRLTPETAK